MNGWKEKMVRTLRRRIKRLEDRGGDGGGPQDGGTLIVRRGESIEQALQQAEQDGRSGPFLILPAILPLDIWEAECRRYHEVMFAGTIESVEEHNRRMGQYYGEFPDAFGAAEWRQQQGASG